jgi:hypothetical protein
MSVGDLIERVTWSRPDMVAIASSYAPFTYSVFCAAACSCSARPTPEHIAEMIAREQPLIRR